MTAPSIKEALELAEDVLSRAPFSTAMWPNGMHPNTGIGKIRAALATLQPDSGRREAIARILEPQAWAALGIGDTLAYKNRRTSSLRKADCILASGLVQNEAGEPTATMIDAGVAFALSVSLSGEYRWSQYVADLYKTMRAAAIRSARDGGAES